MTLRVEEASGSFACGCYQWTAACRMALGNATCPCFLVREVNLNFNQIQERGEATGVAICMLFPKNIAPSSLPQDLSPLFECQQLSKEPRFESGCIGTAAWLGETRPFALKSKSNSMVICICMTLGTKAATVSASSLWLGWTAKKAFKHCSLKLQTRCQMSCVLPSL